MCVIIVMTAGATINKRQLYNAVYNNWQGYGLALKDQNGMMQVIKKFDDKGSDPDEIWKILEENKDIERVLHVRYCTKGAADAENTQPFDVYTSAGRRVVFFHNGTLPSYGSNTSFGKSDTLEFSEKILQPVLLRWTGEKGKADYTDPAFTSLILDKHWTSTSRGLLYSNDLSFLKMGTSWSEYKHPDDTSSGTVYVSTTDYFDRIQRGPMFQKLEEERKAREAEDKKNEPTEDAVTSPFSSSSSSVIKVWANGNSKSPKIIKAVKDILDAWEIDDPAKVAKLRFVSYDEWLQVLEDQGEYTAAALIEVFAKHIADLCMKNSALTRKQKAAEEHIRKLVDGVANANAA